METRPRSTPIPGAETFIPTDDAIPGNAESTRPPRPSEFVQAAAGFASPAPPPGARAPLPGMHHSAGAPELQDFTFVPLTRRRRRTGRGWGWLLMVIIYGAGPVAGLSAAAFAFFKAREAWTEASELSNPTLSDRDREALGLPDTVETLFQADAPLRIAALYEQTLAGEPTRFTQILLYPDYAFATAQDPTAPTHLDQYPWRSGEIGTPTAQPSVPVVELKLFSAGDVNWAAVAQVAGQAASLTQVDDGAITHISIAHSTFQPTFPAVVRIYVTGDRGSGYVEMAPTGEILAVH